MVRAAYTSRSKVWPGALLLTLLAGCGSCGTHRSEAPQAPAAAAHRTEEGVRPVYETTGPADVRAARLCHALHALPEERRAACCGSPPAVDVAGVCTGVLSAALNSQALVLEASVLEACSAALANAYQGCEWVGPFGPLLPKECQDLFSGRRQAGEACRSSLECAGALLCAGAGPTDLGRCSSPAEKGASCSTAVDALATYTRQDAERSHPPCKGLCRRHRCEEPLADEAACVTSQECGPDHHCANGRCASGIAQVGERCSGGDCGMGQRCVNGTCRIPLGSGAACTSDFECRGGCLGDAGSRSCGMRCDLR